MFYAFSCHGQHSFSLYSFADKYSITEIRRVVLRATARKEIHMQFILFSLGCFGAVDSVFAAKQRRALAQKKQLESLHFAELLSDFTKHVF